MSRTPNTATDEWIPDFFVAGPQKCATTWIYEGLVEHPDVYVPDTDSIHYFDINYDRGSDWYRQHFPTDPEEYPVIGEETASYARSDVVPERIAELNPDAKVIISVRNPVDRAFSHYWHEKAKGKISFAFEEVFENYDLYENWIRPGMYVDHIDRFERALSSEQVKLMYFDDLVADDEAFIQEVYEFVGADPTFRPSILDERVNDARQSFGIDAIDNLYYRAVNFAYRNFDDSIKKVLRPVHETVQSAEIGGILGSNSEYERGMRPETRQRLERVFSESVRELESRTGRTFENWFEHVEDEE